MFSSQNESRIQNRQVPGVEAIESTEAESSEIEGYRMEKIEAPKANDQESSTTKLTPESSNLTLWLAVALLLVLISWRFRRVRA